MCGINGFISGTLHHSGKKPVVLRMNAALSHRGPDNEGYWESGNVALGHRRLSIIDLSPLCNQPFFSSDKKYVIVYNGELYNYRELKLELQRSVQGDKGKPYFFTTQSDTEVVLAAYLKWGSACLHKFNGMYAFAICEIESGSVFIARDRLGVKPLYYSYSDEGLLFSSEIRSILRAGVRNFRINEEVLPEYIMYQTVHAPNTIIKGIRCLMPGHYMEYSNGNLSITSYYDINKLSQAGNDLDYKQTCNRVRELLYHSVQRRMVSDVPFGAFLSGGIDSSIIVGLMTEVASGPVETFNVSFEEGEFSEARFANIVAKKFNTRHHEIRLSPRDFLLQVPEALDAMDHPGGDGPNTYVVSKATKNAGIKMSLSGVGGDELFAGYQVFTRMKKLQKMSGLNLLPIAARATLGAAVIAAKRGVAGKKMAELLSLKTISFAEAYPLTRSLFTKNELKRLFDSHRGTESVKSIVQKVPQYNERLFSSVTLAELNTYLPNILLRDADQMGMAVALEIREPFLDHQLLEFVLGVRDEFKEPLTPKKLLVDSMQGLIPPEVVNRPKMGFTLPWQYWLKNEMKSFCRDNLSELSKRHPLFEKADSVLFERFLRGDQSITWSRVWHLVVLNHYLRKHSL